MMDREEFPRPIRIGKRAVAWPQSAIEAWLADRPASTGGK
ncbi:DNA-binding protein [Sulfitobacter mediterraneus KCTC 32188]|nr:DNA-binding protein [Sulfitobacter mediterraneus KCTC 32188]